VPARKHREGRHRVDFDDQLHGDRKPATQDRRIDEHGGDLTSLINWRTIAGLATFGMAGIRYAVVLRWLPLNVAISFAAAQYVGVLVASAVVLRESIAPPQWLGFTLIAPGIVIIGWSQR
jgi:drug/metabolite transporter (DMT)-like permease